MKLLQQILLFAATVEVIALLNLKPILIDVDLETFNICLLYTSDAADD